MVPLVTDSQNGTRGFPINLETGRYNNVPRLERYCDMCDLRLVEIHEIHVLIYCPAYSDQRTVLMKHVSQAVVGFVNLDETAKQAYLLTEKTLIRKVSDYLDYVLKERRHKLRVT